MTKKRDHMERCYGALGDGMTARPHDVARHTGLHYSQEYAALEELLREGRVEKLRGDDMGHVHWFDGRPVWLAPEANAVGYRRVLTSGEVDELEALWNAPAADAPQ